MSDRDLRRIGLWSVVGLVGFLGFYGLLGLLDDVASNVARLPLALVAWLLWTGGARFIGGSMLVHWIGRWFVAVCDAEWGEQ